MRDLLDVSSRNHEANANVLADADTLAPLMGYEWSDDGETAGHLIGWIGPDANQTEDPQAANPARRTYVDMVDTMTDTGGTTSSPR